MADQSKTIEPAQRMKILVESSHNIEVDRNIPIARYLKSSRELVKSAVSHQESGDIEKAFVLYLRNMSLILERLPTHPEWNKADKTEKLYAKNQCNIIFDLAEKLKSQIKEKYEREYKAEKVSNESVVIKTAEPSTKETSQLDDIDKKFNFKRDIPNDDQDTVLQNLFDLDKLKESLSSTK